MCPSTEELVLRWKGLMTTSHTSRRLGTSRIAAMCAAGVIALAACGGGSAASQDDGIASIGTPAAAESANATEASDQTGGAPSTEPQNEEEAVADFEKAYEDYERCLQDIGIDTGGFLVTGESGGAVVQDVAQNDEAASAGGPAGAITEDQLERMQDECDPLLEGIDNGFDLSPEQEAEFRDLELKFAQCMRENGLPDFADPAAQGAGVDGEPSVGGGAIEIAEGDFEVFQEAAEACDQIFEEGFAVEANS